MPPEADSARGWHWALLLLAALASLRLVGAAVDSPVLVRLGIIAAVAPLPHPIDTVPRESAIREYRVTLHTEAGDQEQDVPPIPGPHRAVIPWLRAEVMCWRRPWREQPSERCLRLTRLAFCEGARLPREREASAAASRISLFARSPGAPAFAAIGSVQCGT